MQEIREVCKYYLKTEIWHSCECCPLNCICFNYVGEPIKSEWNKEDIKTAKGILEKIKEIAKEKGRYIPLAELNFEEVTVEELNKYPMELILKHIKDLTVTEEQLQEQLDYEYETSLGWDI